MIVFDSVYNQYMQKRIHQKASEEAQAAGGEA